MATARVNPAMKPQEFVPFPVREAFDQLASRRRAGLVRLAGRITGSYEDAEDVVQDALLRAYVNLSGFRGECRLETWLHTIVTNTARGRLRYARLRRTIPLDCDEAVDECVPRVELPDPGCTPEEAVGEKEMRLLIREEMELLHPRYEAVVRTCDLLGYSYRETAELLNLDIKIVRSRLFRGRKILKNRIRASMTQGREACSLTMLSPAKNVSAT